MKAATIERTATTCWAPLQYQQEHSLCPMIAMGSISGAFDASFSSKTDLEVFALDLANAATSTQQGVISLGKTASNSRFNSLAWSLSGVGQQEEKQFGIIAGGKEDGSLDLYNPYALSKNLEADQVLFFHKQVHTGHVSALDFNPFAQNLLATGATQGEIFIWDLNNPDKPYSPGTKSPRLEDLTSLAWNRQVQHILASSSSNGYSVVWDLKNRREIVHLTSPTRKRVTSIAWNPEVATQLLTASDDDNVPAIYMWDLRNAHAPEKILTGHHKGVLSISWSQKDSDLLLSSGKDNRTLCWNPSTAEIIGEFPTSDNWVFDVQWCPKNPDLFSAASFDGKVSFYTIQAKSSDETKPSAPTDPFAPQTEKPFTLKQPPKWLRCPVGASFGFGNQLVTFKSSVVDGKPVNKVLVRQLVTDDVLVAASKKLQSTIEQNSVTDVCEEHMKDAATNRYETSVWKFMDFINHEDARQKIVHYLGFDREKLAAEFSSLKISSARKTSQSPKPPATSLTSPKTMASTIVQDVFSSAMASVEASGSTGELFENSTNDLSEDFLSGGRQKDNVAVPATSSALPFEFYKNKVTSGVDADITRCIIAGDFDSAVEICLYNDRMDDALMLAVHGGQDLLERTQAEFYRRKKDSTPYLRIASNLSTGDISEIVENANIIDGWKETLALICTFAKPDEFSVLAAVLADRLRDEADIVRDSVKKVALQNAAVLAFMVAGRLDKLVGIWIDQHQIALQPIKKKFSALHVDPEGTHEYAKQVCTLIEKISIYRKIVPEEPKDDPVYLAQMKSLGREYLMYAKLLVDQGELSTALKYLETADVYPGANHAESSTFSPMAREFADELELLKYRIYQSLSDEEKKNTLSKQVPKCPFVPVEPLTKSPAKQQPQVATTPSQGTPVPTAAKSGIPHLPTNSSTGGYNAYSQPSVVPSAYGQPQQYQVPPPVPSYAPVSQAQQVSYAPPPSTTATGALDYSSQAGLYNQQQQQPPQYLQQQYPTGGGYYQQQQPMVAASVPQSPGPSKSLIPQPAPIMNSYGGPSSPPMGHVPFQSGALGAGPGGISQAANQPGRGTSGSASVVSPWNDPGAEMFKSKPKKHSAPAPIPPQFASAATAPPMHQQQQQFAQAPSVTASQPPPPGGPMVRQNSFPQYPPQQQQQQQQQPTQTMGYGGVAGAASVGQFQKPSTPPEKSPVGHPIGDRSHIPAEHRPVYESLVKLLNQCKPNAGPPQRKMLDDAEKRLNLLFDRLNNEQLNAAVIPILLDLSRALEGKDWPTALSIQQNLMQNHGSTEGTTWILGLKRLLDLAKSLVK